MIKAYAGIGSRETPEKILSLMQGAAINLERSGYTLHSGGATGADTAFANKVTNKKIFLPWSGFNGHIANGKDIICDIPKQSFAIAKKFYWNYENASSSVRRLMARNTQQILGQNLREPVRFVLCWHNNSGGTILACHLAEHLGIPVINMNKSNWSFELSDILSQNKF